MLNGILDKDEKRHRQDLKTVGSRIIDVLRISALIEDIPEIQEMDLNPIMAMENGQGCYVADARISVMPVAE